jgi:hypothetical protein
MAHFSLGQIVATPAALEALAESGQDAGFFISKHAACDFGIVCEEDRQLNLAALKDGSRILSAYKTLRGRRIWVLTDAENDEGHRAVTTIMTPECY